jgi:RNA polymerase sigma factor (TIGR02999 family)
MADAADITGLLHAWSSGEEAARGRLVEAVYDELRHVAERHLRRERADHSLTPTALVHEAYLKLVDQTRVQWNGRAHFFSIAAHVMRRILVDHARARGREKRDASITVPLDGIEVASSPVDIDIVALDTALDKLGRLDKRQGQLASCGFSRA